jgi:DNA-binding NarL/FixJ family response regulator
MTLAATHEPPPAPGPKDNDPIDVVLMTGQRLVRDMVSDGLERLGGVRIVASARDAEETIAEAGARGAAVAVVSDDVGWSETIRTVRAVAERVRSCVALVLASSGDVDLLTRAVEAGARGYVTRDATLSELSDAIERLARGGAAIPGGMMRGMLDRLVVYRAEMRDGDRMLSNLSPREREVLLLLADGASSEAIARTLVISKETAYKHIQNILVKMGVRSRLQAVAYVVQGGRRELLETRR